MKHNTVKLALVLALTSLFGGTALAKSVVFTLSDGTMVYYKLSNDEPPCMVIADDGTFTLNDRLYTFESIQYFAISTDDYSGEEGTEDGIASLADGQALMKGQARVYSLDGRLVNGEGSLNGLPQGTYVISDGKTSLKVQKR